MPKIAIHICIATTLYTKKLTYINIEKGLFMKNTKLIEEWLEKLPSKKIESEMHFTLVDNNRCAELSLPDDLALEVVEECFADEVDLNAFADECNPVWLEFKINNPETRPYVDFKITIDNSDREVPVVFSDKINQKFIDAYAKTKDVFENQLIDEDKFLSVYAKMLGKTFEVKKKDDHFTVTGFHFITPGTLKHYSLTTEVNIPLKSLVYAANRAYKTISDRYGDCSTREAIVETFNSYGLEPYLNSLGKLVDEHYSNIYEFGDACMKLIVEDIKLVTGYKNFVDVSFNSDYIEKVSDKEMDNEEDIELD